MNCLRLLLVLALTACTVEIKPLRKKTKKRTAKYSTSYRSGKKSKQSQARKLFKVDYTWMERYLDLERKWKYKIPEDASIEYWDGSYHVPPVVYRHYEDMAKTPETTPTPVPNIKSEL